MCRSVSMIVARQAECLSNFEGGLQRRSTACHIHIYRDLIWIYGVAKQTEAIIQTVLDWIEAGTLTPGDEVDEAALVDLLAVSRTPIREAFISLEANGLLRRLPRKGAVVFKPTLEEFLAIQEVHAELEGKAAELAARRMSSSAAIVLEQTVQACEAHAAAKGDAAPVGYYALNMRFHEAVAAASGNPHLLETIKTTARKLMAYYRIRYRFAGAAKASALDHRHIATLINDRDARGARDAMHAHVLFDHTTAMDVIALLD